MIVATAQYPVNAHQNFGDWRAHFQRWVSKAAAQRAQLLLFPEYASMELVSLWPSAAQVDVSEQVRWMEQIRDDAWTVFEALAKQYRVVLVAPSFPVSENGAVYNRTPVFSPKGLVGWQDKFFMTRFEAEEWIISPSQPPVLRVFEADWGVFGIQTCYDVEFSLGSQYLAQHGAMLILAPSCTETIRGATRVHVGARARALENQCYVAVSQVVGEAPWSTAIDINYGYAALYSPPDAGLPEEGILGALPPDTYGWLVRQLDCAALEAVRQGGQVLNFKDHQRLHSAMLDQTILVEHLQC